MEGTDLISGFWLLAYAAFYTFTLSPFQMFTWLIDLHGMEFLLKIKPTERLPVKHSSKHNPLQVFDFVRTQPLNISRCCDAAISAT